ncbi:uncharacterized protein LOC106868353 [Octopus bimaculoides]|nr:uncharacterized protein LOC106868353 [Octopus bimaculoides]|eukprot:XP_014769054.1 PREDICTED: uncharacterized protein LOC106868353 [Octopus bimaculoides]
MLLMKIFIFLIVVYFNEAEDCVKLNVTINNTMTTMQYIVFGEFNYTTAEKKCLKCNGHLFHVYTKEKMMRLRGHIDVSKKYWIGYERRTEPVWTYPEYGYYPKVLNYTNLTSDNPDEKTRKCIEFDFQVKWEEPLAKCYILCEIETKLFLYKVTAHPNLICNKIYCYEKVQIGYSTQRLVSCNDKSKSLEVESGAEYQFLKENMEGFSYIAANTKTNTPICKRNVIYEMKYVVTTEAIQDITIQETSETAKTITTTSLTTKTDESTYSSATTSQVSTALPSDAEDQNHYTSAMTRKFELNNVQEKKSVVVRSRIECAAFALREKSTSIIYNKDSKICTIYDESSSNNIQCQNNKWCYSFI